MNTYLGIDTSCYTTSVSLVDETYRVIADERKILEVAKGGRGLSQSNMIYQHTRNVPELFEKLSISLRDYMDICAIGVTDKPRRREDSYMPAFYSGYGYARSLAAVLGVPLYVISHQENHLLAVLRNFKKIGIEPFYGLHLSGGTTDFLYVSPDERGLSITRIGGSSDISAGQFLDRVGVAMGLFFPAGSAIDTLAQQCSSVVRGAPVFYKNGEISFSGPESQAQRYIVEKNYDMTKMAQWTLSTIWNGVEKLLDFGCERGMKRLVAAGGVLSNTYLRECLMHYGGIHDIRIDTAEPCYSADNATGAAFWASYAYQKEKK